MESFASHCLSEVQVPHLEMGFIIMTISFSTETYVGDVNACLRAMGSEEVQG